MAAEGLVPPLADSDVASTDSFPLFDIDELNDEEYGIPPVNSDNASISLDDVLFNSEWNEDVEIALADELNLNEAPTPSPIPSINKNNEAPSTAGSLLKYVFLQGISQQITNSLERIDGGVGCAVAAWGDSIAIGTSHGLVTSFTSQVLRWCCQQNKDQAAVTALDYNEDGTRLLAGFARGIVCMYESVEGTILRRVEACGGGPWGVLRVCWVSAISGNGSSAVVADTGGSVWLLRFTRTLGIRGTKVSCLFSGARGEICAIEPFSEASERWGGVLALATLSRVIVVIGVGGIGGARPRAACQASLIGPSDSLPLLAWQPVIINTTDPHKKIRSPAILCSARGFNIQLHQIKWSTSGPKISQLKGPKPFTHKATAIRWLGTRRLAILDSRETLYLWETGANAVVDVLDLSNTQLIYANAHFKGVATGGKVSEALALAGAEALGGSVTNDCITGALFLLGRTGLTRVTARTTLAAAHHHADMGRWVQALDTIIYRYKSLDGHPGLQRSLTQRAKSLFTRLSESPAILTDTLIAQAIIQACVQMDILDILWGPIWDGIVAAKCEDTIVYLTCKRASEGLLPWISPGACQTLVNQMAVKDPEILQKALLHIPLKCMDIHQVLTECRRLELWSAWVRVTAATAPDDPSLPLKELISLVGVKCHEPNHSCPGDVLLLYTADCFAGRLFPTGSISISDRPLIGQEVLRCLLYDPLEEINPDTVRLPHLRALLHHDMGSTLRMLEMSFSLGPFSGPLGKQKRLAMGIALHNVLQTSEPNQFSEEDIAEVVQFTCNRLTNGSLPPDVTLLGHLKKHFSKNFASSKANKMLEISWLNLLKSNASITNHLPQGEMLEMAQSTGRLKVIRFLNENAGSYENILETFLNDIDSDIEMFSYLEKHASNEDRLIAKQVVTFGKQLATQWPEHTAQFLFNNFPELIPTVLATLGNESPALEFTNFLRKQETLDADLASKHLELLCILKPDSVLEFLNDAPATLLPETALKLIKKYDIQRAEPKCLESTGDLANALKIAIKLMCEASDRDEIEQLAGDAYSLCARASKLSGPVEAESFWRQLIESISNLPTPPGPPLPALLLEGASYHLPLPWLVNKLCSHGGHTGAFRNALISLLEAAKDNAEAMAATARLAGSELHISLATALRGKRVLPITSTICGYCFNPLHTRSFVRAYCCGHAFHLDCDPVSERCGRCGKSTVEIRKARAAQTPQSIRGETTQPFSLCIVAPPRPDLEGVI